MKVIMCDIDGVLTTLSTKWKTFHPDCVKALKRVIDTTGAKVVLSSSWRKGFIDWREPSHLVHSTQVLTVMKELFKEAGLPSDCLIDVTPFSRDGYRGSEITLWLNKNSGVHHGDYVILDDDNDLEPHMDRWVDTSWGDGMNEADADRAILLLTS